jgi:DnaJ-class molecular chaperone
MRMKQRTTYYYDILGIAFDAKSDEIKEAEENY